MYLERFKVRIAAAELATPRYCQRRECSRRRGSRGQPVWRLTRNNYRYRKNEKKKQTYPSIHTCNYGDCRGVGEKDLADRDGGARRRACARPAQRSHGSGIERARLPRRSRSVASGTLRIVLQTVYTVYTHERLSVHVLVRALTLYTHRPYESKISRHGFSLYSVALRPGEERRGEGGKAVGSDERIPQVLTALSWHTGCLSSPLGATERPATRSSSSSRPARCVHPSAPYSRLSLANSPSSVPEPSARRARRRHHRLARGTALRPRILLSCILLPIGRMPK